MDMLDPATLAFDIDGVIADTMTLFLEIASDVFGINSFVEDRLDTCYLLQDAGIRPILFKQPWNRESHPFVEIRGWEELEGLINFMDTAIDEGYPG